MRSEVNNEKSIKIFLSKLIYSLIYIHPYTMRKHILCETLNLAKWCWWKAIKATNFLSFFCHLCCCYKKIFFVYKSRNKILLNRIVNFFFDSSMCVIIRAMRCVGRLMMMMKKKKLRIQGCIQKFFEGVVFDCFVWTENFKGFF